MPGRDITRQWNRTSKVLLLLALVLCVGRVTSVSGRAQEPAKQDQSKPSGNEQPSTESQDKDSQGQAPDSQGVFVFRKDVDEVMLHATVVDDKQHIITNLDRTGTRHALDGVLTRAGVAGMSMCVTPSGASVSSARSSFLLPWLSTCSICPT